MLCSTAAPAAVRPDRAAVELRQRVLVRAGTRQSYGGSAREIDGGNDVANALYAVNCVFWNCGT